MRRLLDRLRLAALDETGQTMAEYAVVLAVITVAIVAAIASISSSITDAVSTISGRI